MAARGQFKIGDLVVLKSGGPTMTVTDVDKINGNIRCQWFAGKKLEHGQFKPDALEPALDPVK